MEKIGKGVDGGHHLPHLLAVGDGNAVLLLNGDGYLQGVDGIQSQFCVPSEQGNIVFNIPDLKPVRQITGVNNQLFQYIFEIYVRRTPHRSMLSLRRNGLMLCIADEKWFANCKSNVFRFSSAELSRLFFIIM